MLEFNLHIYTRTDLVSDVAWGFIMGIMRVEYADRNMEFGGFVPENF